MGRNTEAQKHVLHIIKYMRENYEPGDVVGTRHRALLTRFWEDIIDKNGIWVYDPEFKELPFPMPLDKDFN